jgi:hypothetical protein
LARSWSGFEKKALGGGVFEDHAFVEEDDPIGNFARETHLVRDHQHGDAAVRQFAHHRQDFVDHFRVQRRSGLVKQQDLRVHRQRTRDRHPLLLAAGQLDRVLAA